MQNQKQGPQTNFWGINHRVNPKIKKEDFVLFVHFIF